MKDTFIIYTSFYEPIKEMSDKQLGRIFRALFDYRLGNEWQVEDDIKMAFMFFKNQMDIDERKYNNIVEGRKQSGSKGGAPKGNSNARKKTIESEEDNKICSNKQNKQMVEKTSKTSKTTLNDNDNDNDIKKEILSSESKKKKEEIHPEIASEFENFKVWMSEKAPFCSNASNFQQLDIYEYNGLRRKYDKTQIADIILKLENRRDLRDRYALLWKTVNDWLKREYENGNK